MTNPKPHRASGAALPAVASLAEPRPADPAQAEVEEALARVSFLQGETMGSLRELARLAVPRTYPKGNVLFYHGEPASTVYLILSGQVKISLLSEEGREVILAVIRPSELIGLDAALVEAHYFGSASTLRKSRLAKIPGPEFLAWLEHSPAAQNSLLSEMARRLRLAYEKIGEQALLPVKRRLLTTLVEIARSEGIEDDNGHVTFVRPTHQELADLVGSSRVVVSRILKELIEEQRALAAEGNVIRVYMQDLVLQDDFGA